MSRRPRRVEGDWRAPLIAAFVALLAGLPGLFALPVLDRDEARFAQASAQMLESGDYVSINFQDRPRYKKPVGIYWLQAASVAAFNQLENRAIWAWRIPSLLGAMLAAAATAWGARGFASVRASSLAGALIGAGLLLSTEADIAATDAALAGATAVMMAALLRIYLTGGGRRTRVLFWLGLGASLMLKGPIGPMILILTLAALALIERRMAWMRDLAWGWGGLGVLLLALPWAAAITVATDGAFWSAAVAGDLAPKLKGGHEGHFAPPGLHLLLLPVLVFPATFVLPGAVMATWARRAEPAVRFALCWLLPSWLVFEAAPTKLAHYTLPLYPAVGLLIAVALERPASLGGRWIGVLLGLGVGVALAALGPLAVLKFHAAGLWPFAGLAVAGGLVAAAGGAFALLRGAVDRAVWTGIGGTLVAHAALLGLVAPGLDGLWLSRSAAAALKGAGLDPNDGVAKGPVAVVGYAEPSLIFRLGTDTDLTDAEGAQWALAQGRPAIVTEEFESALGARARPVARVSGLNYTKNRIETLVINAPPHFHLKRTP
jgi:4-amino-4-deoxy-L-arabinose transferase-like glycosyltransferase